MTLVTSLAQALLLQYLQLIGLVGVVAEVGVSVLVIGTILSVTVILWRYHLCCVKKKVKNLISQLYTNFQSGHHAS